MNGQAAELLDVFVSRIERLEEDRKAIGEDIKQVKAEAKVAGFDLKTINEIIRERKLSEAEVEERQALLDIYRAALGMLHDTPLGEAARRRLDNPPPPDGQEDPSPKDGEDGEAPPDGAPGSDPDEADDAPPKEPIITKRQITAARKAGTKAAKDGEPVHANPFVAGDPRRAAWDEAWCAAAQSDGMEIPAAWQRKKDPKKPNKREPKT